MNHLLDDHTGPELVDLFYSVRSHAFKPGSPAEKRAGLLEEAIVETLSDKYPKYLPYVGVIRKRESS